MRKVEIVSVTDEHISAILPHVRQADHDEFMAAAGMTPEEVITRAMKSASVAAAGMINGRGNHLRYISGIDHYRARYSVAG